MDSVELELSQCSAVGARFTVWVLLLDFQSVVLANFVQENVFHFELAISTAVTDVLLVAVHENLNWKTGFTSSFNRGGLLRTEVSASYS